MKLRGFISVLALLGCLGAYAAPKEQSVSAKIGYGIGKTEVNTSVRSNGKAVDVLDNVLEEARVSRIEVTSASSPDGPYSVNKRLAGERASQAVEFLKGRYGLADSLFVIKTIAEDWQGVAAYLRRSDKPWKEDALKIIESAGKNRKAQLQDLWVGEAWDDLMKNAFPGLRSTKIRVVIESSPLEQEKDRLLFARGYRQPERSEENFAVLSSLKEKIAAGYDGVITLTGYSSPDGSAAANDKLALARASVVRDYLVNELHYLADKIAIENGGVDWEKFASTVEYSYYGADRGRVLEILRDQNLSSAQKKRALIALEGGNTWAKLKADYMDQLCVVKVGFEGEPVVTEEPVVAEEPVVVEEPVVIVEPVVTEEEPVVIEQPEVEEPEVVEEKPKEEVTPMTEEPVEKIEESEKVSETAKSPKVILGVGTNLLFDAVTAVNASLDIPVGKHWDITADYTFPWWKDRNKSFVFQFINLDLGARYYFKPWEQRNQDVMRGWFASASVGAGYYDFALWNPKGVQGEEFKISLGGGYTWALSPWWRLTAELGVGPVFTQYRLYEAEAPDRLIVTEENRNVFLRPTTAKISLTYLLHTCPKGR